MIGLVAIIKVKDGMAEEFEKVFVALTAQVRANEPGNIFYQLTRSRTEPLTYKVLELYKDEDALKAHGGSDHFRASGKLMGPCLDGRPVLEYLDAVV